jgi:putative flippase GtrA
MQKQALSFAFVSGVGWVLDFLILSMLVNGDVSPGLSNLCSATVAAIFVYFVARKFIFKRSFGLAATGGFVFYVIYTLCIVLFFSFLIQLLTPWLHDLLIGIGVNLTLAFSAMISKVIVTPINLAINFVVAKFITLRM